MRQLVVVGLMGSGKSTVGALVANRTGGRLVDVDVVIAEETGKTVRELWEEGGEDAYRGQSGAVLRTLADDTPSVLAAPGGVVLDPAVRAALAGHIVVWLRTTPAALASRVHAATIVRCWATRRPRPLRPWRTSGPTSTARWQPRPSTRTVARPTACPTAS